MHAINNDVDADILLLLHFHMEKFKCSEVWVSMGTAKKPKFVLVNKVYESLQTGLITNILAFHALTGSRHHIFHTRCYKKILMEDMLKIMNCY